MKDNFDKNIEKCIQEKLENLDVPKDMFENAWNKNLILKNKEKYIMKRDMKKIICAASLSIALLGGAMVSLPSARAAVKTFFGLNSDGNIIEMKDSDTTNVNCSIKLTDENKNEIEKILGFEIVQADSIGKYTKACDMPVPGLSVLNVQYKDENKVLNQINNSTNYTDTVNNLKKKYDVKSTLLSMYCSSENLENIKIFCVGQTKSKYKYSVEKSIKIDNVDCTICFTKTADYKKKVVKDSAGLISGIEDIDTERPNGTKVYKCICFAYNGMNYSISGDDTSTINDETLNFAEEYIKYLKSQN